MKSRETITWHTIILNTRWVQLLDHKDRNILDCISFFKEKACDYLLLGSIHPCGKEQSLEELANPPFVQTRPCGSKGFQPRPAKQNKGSVSLSVSKTRLATGCADQNPTTTMAGEKRRSPWPAQTGSFIRMKMTCHGNRMAQGAAVVQKTNSIPGVLRKITKIKTLPLTFLWGRRRGAFI